MKFQIVKNGRWTQEALDAGFKCNHPEHQPKKLKASRGDKGDSDTASKHSVSSPCDEVANAGDKSRVNILDAESSACVRRSRPRNPESFCEKCYHNKEAHAFGNCAYCNCKGFKEKKKEAK